MLRSLALLWTALETAARSFLIFAYELLFLCFQCPEMLPSVYRLWERSLRHSPYHAYQESQAQTNNPLSETYDEYEFTYGEVLLPTIYKIVRFLQLGPDDYLIDLGAGRGRVVMLTAALGIPAKGIELLFPLLQLARHASEPLPLAQFEENDLLQADLTEATALWFSGTCFRQSTRKEIAEKLLHCQPGTWLISISSPLQHEQLPIKHTVYGWTSWGRSPIFLQQVQPSTLPQSDNKP